MTHNGKRLLLLALFLSTLGLMTSVQAGVISAGLATLDATCSGGVQIGTCSNSIGTTDDSVQSIDKEFIGIGPLSFSGTTQPTTTGATVSFSEVILNDTSLNWTSYSLGLTGAGLTLSSVVSSGPLCSLDGAMTGISCGSVTNGVSFTLDFLMNVAGGSETVGRSFTITQGPSTSTGRGVPEPATLALLGLGLVGMGASRRRRKSVI